MKTVYAPIAFLILLNFFPCSRAYAGGEDDAIKKISGDIYDKKELLKDKKLAVTNFTSLDGEETLEGKRLSKKLLEYLMQKGGMKFIERSEIDKLMKEYEIEQSGLVDASLADEGGAILPVDILINGTIAQLGVEGEISVKAVSVSTGEILTISSSKYSPEKKFSYTENAAALELYKKAPEKVEIVNRTVNALNMMYKKRPLAFLTVTMDDSDRAYLQKMRPRMAREIEKRNEKWRSEKPRDLEKFTKLKENLPLVKEHAPLRYNLIMRNKDDLIKSPSRRRGAVE